jgi:hypothetical protein
VIHPLERLLQMECEQIQLAVKRKRIEDAHGS